MLAFSAQKLQHDYPTLERKRLLYQLSQDPGNYQRHLEDFTSRTASHLSWGDASHSQRLKDNTFGLLKTISPGGALPDSKEGAMSNIVCWLASLPRFMSPWKKAEKTRSDKEMDFFEDVFNSARHACCSPNKMPESYLKYYLSGSEKERISETEAAYVAGMMAIASALTMSSPMISYILAMCHFPEWQVKLQEEMDNVCQGRCPRADREHLPTLRAVISEIVKWRPLVPTGERRKMEPILSSADSLLQTGIPHCLEEDDVYKGYHIPAGATIHALEWSA